MISARILTFAFLFAGATTAQTPPPVKGEKKPPVKTLEIGKQDKKPAQGKKPNPVAKKPVAKKPVAKKPVAKKDQEKVPEVDTTKLLENSLNTAKREHEYLQKVLKAGGLLKRFKMNQEMSREMNLKFMPEVSGPTLPGKRKARLLGDGEKEQLSPSVAFTVEGVEVTMKEYEAAKAYLKSYPRSDSVVPVETSAILALVKSKAGQGSFRTTARPAKQMLDNVAKKLEAGESFSDLAAKFSADKLTASNGGKRDYMRRDSMDESYAMAAFGLKIGQVSGVVASQDGYHILRVLGRKKGESPDQDQVLTAHIFRPYSIDQARCKKLASDVAAGRIDVAFRNDALRKLAPAQFR